MDYSDELNFSDAAAGGTNIQSEKSSVPRPQVFPMENTQSRYAEHPQPPAYSDQDRAMHAGYGPDSNLRNMQYQLPVQPGPQPVMQQPVAMQSNTTVIVQQPPAPEIKVPRQWTTPMCNCCSDFGVCLMVTFCGECYGCCFMDQLGESCCLPCCFPMGWMAAARAKIRNKYNIQGSLMDDFCLTSGCCACFTRSCVFCQMVREVKIQTQLGNPM